MNVTQILENVNGVVWGAPMIVLIMFTGIFLTVRLRGVQLTHLLTGFKLIFKTEEGSDGEVSSFGSLCTALSATIGTGNIVGVATAIGVLAGGPGALFWMWIAALFGMATKYAEGYLAVKYRKVDKNGHILGGPFYYIEKGMGKKWKWLAKMFAFFGSCAGLLGIGTITQVNGIAKAVKYIYDPNNENMITILGARHSLTIVYTAVIASLLALLVIVGGIKRISKVSEIVVPFMAGIYILAVLVLIITNISKLPSAIAEIITGAFGSRAVAGGGFASIAIAMKNGVARGIFSNEAGLGSAPIAAAAAKTKEPVRQGLVSMMGTFIDTVVVCTMTGLAIVITGMWKNENISGVDVTIRAFQKGLPIPGGISGGFVMISLCFFAFTTILGWNYYGERCIEYLTNGRKALIGVYRTLYIIAVFVGPYLTVKAVWTIADIFNGLMALPNILALLFLSPVIVKGTREYFKRNN